MRRRLQLAPPPALVGESPPVSGAKLKSGGSPPRAPRLMPRSASRIFPQLEPVTPASPRGGAAPMGALASASSGPVIILTPPQAPPRACANAAPSVKLAWLAFKARAEQRGGGPPTPKRARRLA